MLGTNDINPFMTFGWKPNVVDNGILINDKSVLYVANKYLVIYNQIELTQDIQPLNKKGFSTALAVNTNKRLAAVAMYIPGQIAQIEMFSIPFGKKSVLNAEIVENKVFFLMIVIIDSFSGLVVSVSVMILIFLLLLFLWVLHLLLCGILNVKNRDFLHFCKCQQFLLLFMICFELLFFFIFFNFLSVSFTTRKIVFLLFVVEVM
jgi:hypothetical protein